MRDKIYPKLPLISLTGLLLSTSCTTLPASGPYGDDVREAATLKLSEEAIDATFEKYNFILIDISKSVTNYLSAQEKFYAYPAGWPKDKKPSDIQISVNDMVEVTIYESQSGGLFIPSEAGVRPGNFVTIPAQQVDQSGEIYVPFAGSIKVVGRRPIDVANEISEKLGNRAIEPQAIISVVDRRGAEVSVIGEVEDADRFSLSINGDRILDSIAQAGGPRYPGYETLVTLQRSGQEWTIPFDLLLMEPDKNIHLLPGDTVYLYREPETFQMFGASGFNGTHPFTKREMTLAEAIGESRGLRDDQADPAEIYLYRNENSEHVENIAYAHKLDLSESLEETNPVIYRLNLRDPEGFFLAQAFPIRDEDIIYIANAEAVEFTKFLNLLGNISGTKITTQSAVEQ